MTRFSPPALRLFRCLNLMYFWYNKITNAGLYTCLGSHAEWCEYFAAEKLYLKYSYLRHPKLLKEGIHFLKHDNEMEDPELQQILVTGKDKFKFGQGVQILTKTPDGIEEFGFTSPSFSESQTSLLLSELPLLRLFGKKFRAENPFLSARLEENQVNLIEVVGATFYNNSSMAMPKRKEEFLRELGVEVGRPLSAREREIIKLMLDGYSAGQIAPRIFLSKRTVEHHVERIKEKWGCESKTELIQKGRELELVGCLEAC